MACEAGSGAASRRTTETEVARIERGEEAGLTDLGLRLAEAKQLTAALQAEMVSAQLAIVGEQRGGCTTCGRPLASKGHYRATFRSLFGDVPVRVRRLLFCPCHGPGEPKSFAAVDLGAGPAPELAYVTAKFAAVVPFGKVAALLSELLPISGAQNAGTVRNRTLRVGQNVVRCATKNAELPATPAAGPVVVGLDGSYVRSRHRPERHFEVVAGKVIDAQGTQHRFAFARNGQATSAAASAGVATAGVQADTPATVLCDGDAGLWRLQREVLPSATIVLDWWHAAVRFEHALQAARGLGAGPADAHLVRDATAVLERAKWCLWHGRWTGCRRKLAALRRWTRRQPMRDVAGIGRLQRHVSDLLGYFERNRDALVPYAARRRRGEPISTAFVESAVNAIVRALTGRHRGITLERMIRELVPYLRGWAGYFGFSQWRELASLDGWIRRRLRCVVWVQWKTRGRRYRELRRLKVSEPLSRWRRELQQQAPSAERPPAPAFVPLALPSPAEPPHMQAR